MKNQLLDNKCPVINDYCEWQNGDICTIAGIEAKNVKKCEFGDETFVGYVAFDNMHGNYILSKVDKKDFHDHEECNMVVFSVDNLMKYNGKKIKIKVEVIE